MTYMTGCKKYMRTLLVLGILFFMFAMPVNAAKDSVKLAYVNWSSAIASTNLIKAVLQQKMGDHCAIQEMAADEAWSAVAEGEVDGMLCAWLPLLHEHYKKEYKDEVVDLGPNLEGTKSGLVVPNISLGRQTAGSGQINEPYIKADSIADLNNYKKKFNYKIVGIDPEAGVMKRAEEAMEAYGLDEYNLVQGSEKTMTKALDRAVSRQEWIVVTGWIPHWKFARWELKFLDDPKNVFGESGNINTIVRQGLKQDKPEVYELLNNFYMEPEELEKLMIWIHDKGGKYPYEQALRYVRTNEDQVNSWIP